MRKIRNVLLLLTILFSTSVWASIPLPENFLNLAGAFEGRGLQSNERAYLLVYNVSEDNQPSGRFNIFLLTRNRLRGQILQAEYVDATTLAVLVSGPSADEKHIEPKLPPAGVLELVLNPKWGRTLRLSKQEGQGDGLEESYEFVKNSEDIQINTSNPIGLFNNREDSISSTQGIANTLNVIARVSSLNFSGKFVGVFELAGVVVLRKEVLDNSLYQYNEGEISGLMVSIYDGRRPMVIIGRLSDGSPQLVSIVPTN